MRPIKMIGFAVALAASVTAPVYADVIETGTIRASIAAANAPVADSVDRYYAANGNRLIWLSSGSEAALAVAARLEHGDLDGFGDGPMRAKQIRDAIAAANSPAAKLEADKLVSKAWTRYVRSFDAPVGDVIYGDQRVTPTPRAVERILADAAAAKALDRYVARESVGSETYERMRAAAIATFEAKGQRVPSRVLTNLARLRQLPRDGRYVLVDAASQQLFMVEDGRTTDRMKVIVGKRQYATPMIASMIYYAAVNPYWHVPDHLVRQTIATNVIKKGPAYLKANGYELVADWEDRTETVSPASVDWKAVASGSRQLKVRQLPGATNAMGKIKFYFANGEGIYLHDTPNKDLFAKNERTLSNGCVRLEDAPRLARFLMGSMPSPAAGTPEQIVKLNRGIPVFVTYLTVGETAGSLTYTADVYGRDGPVTALN